MGLLGVLGDMLLVELHTNRSSISCSDKTHFCCPKTLDPETTVLTIQFVTGAVSLGIRRPQPDAEYLFEYIPTLGLSAV